jgi:hypothetical protein
MKLTVRDALSLLDHEVWAEVVPENDKGKGLDLTVWSADWHCDQYWPKDLERFLDWEVDDIRVKVGTDPETHRRTPVLVIPAYEPARKRRRRG